MERRLQLSLRVQSNGSALCAGPLPAAVPAASRFMEAAAVIGCSSVARQLLATDPTRALASLNASEAERMPLPLAALGGHAAVFQLLLKYNS